MTSRPITVDELAGMSLEARMMYLQPAPWMPPDIQAERAQARAMWDEHQHANGVPVMASDGNGVATMGDNLPDEFWTARPILDHIRRAAWHRLQCPDAVFGVVLARVSMLTPTTTVLPPVVGAVSTFDVVVAIVAASGGGKSSAMAIGRELLPNPFDRVRDDAMVGSGEGLIEAFLEDVSERVDGKTERRKVQRFDAILFEVDEGEAFTQLGTRKGSTLGPTLRSAWSGKALGQDNASHETRRRLPARAARVAVVLACQPSMAAGILGDVGVGTPQRMLWLPGLDPSVPEGIEWPGPLDWTPSPWFGTIDQPHHLTIDDDIRRWIRSRHRQRVRGEIIPDAMTNHDVLQRLKVAGLLAGLDGRHHDINGDDWWLAGIVIDVSVRTRQHIGTEARADAEREHRDRDQRAARRHITVETATQRHALDQAVRLISRKVGMTNGPVPHQVLRDQVGGSFYRQRGVPPAMAIEAAIDQGVIVAADGGGYVAGVVSM